MEAGHEQLKKSLKFALRIERSDNTVTSFLSSHRMPWYATEQTTERPNELTHKFSDLNSWGKVYRGKRSCVQVRLCTFFILVIRIKMNLWVLFRLQIESPIRQYVHLNKWNDSAMNFWQNFFFPNLELLNSGCGLSASVAYTPVFTVFYPRLMPVHCKIP